MNRNAENLKKSELSILGLNWADEIGKRFNGLALAPSLNAYGIKYDLFAGLVNEGIDTHVVGQEFAKSNFRLNSKLANVEALTGFQSRMFFPSNKILSSKEFKSADLIHAHIVHNGWFRIENLLKIKKPILWSLHDPWITTGHCIYPYDCNNWKSDCGNCPDLLRPLAVARDRTRAEVQRKKKIVKKLGAHYHVSTEWMRNLIVERYPFLDEQISVIPFGIDTKVFSPRNLEGKFLREKLDIAPDTLVVLIRASTEPQKGLAFAKTVLEKLGLNRKIHIFTLEQPDHFLSTKNQVNATDFGWVKDDDYLAAIYSAADVFLMPSIAETFGMMALEAMSCGTPVVYQKETAIHNVVEADGLFTYTYANRLDELHNILMNLYPGTQNMLNESTRVRARAESHFSLTKYALEMSELYRNLCGV